MAVTVYQYPNCSTCRKALKWLDAHGVAYDAIDITERPPSKRALKAHWQTSGLPLRKLFNTSGQSYRRGGFKEKLETMSDADAIAALAADGKLIKRPIVIGDGFVLVGFDPDAYEEKLG